MHTEALLSAECQARNWGHDDKSQTCGPSSQKACGQQEVRARMRRSNTLIETLIDVSTGQNGDVPRGRSYWLQATETNFGLFEQEKK